MNNTFTYSYYSNKFLLAKDAASMMFKFICFYDFDYINDFSNINH